MSIDLIRNRPQFDIEMLKPGTAIKYKYCKEPFSTFRNALIVSSEIDKIRVAVYEHAIIKDNVWLYLNDAVECNLIIEILGGK